VSTSNRRWGELARKLEFSQLDELRRVAEGWRTGLTALAGLLAGLAVLKGRENLADLSPTARNTAMLLAAGAFLLLVVGALLAVRASHGWVGAKIYLTPERLRAWTEREVVKVRGFLRAAAVCCVLGVALGAAAIGVAWVNATPPPPNLVRVSTSTTTLCGELVSAGPGGVAVWTGQGKDRQLRTLPAWAAASVAPTKTCP